MIKNWYQELYDDFGTYCDEPYVQNTCVEVDFIEQILDHDRSKLILDVGCGNGRHSLELARRGYDAMGIDLSSSMLEQARRAAKAEHLTLTFTKSDARKIEILGLFDAAIMLCEGAFSLMEEDEMDLMILCNIFRALKPGGKLVMTLPNAAFMLVNESNEAFDITTFRETFTLEKTMPDGAQKTLECIQRYYTCPELKGMLHQAGFHSLQFFACTDSGYDRGQKPTRSQFEFGAIAQK